jgi:hypothetical protein
VDNCGVSPCQQADTVGVCTLRVGHMNFVPPCTLKLDFLGEAWRIVIVIVIMIMAATSLNAFTTVFLGPRCLSGGVAMRAWWIMIVPAASCTTFTTCKTLLASVKRRLTWPASL